MNLAAESVNTKVPYAQKVAVLREFWPTGMTARDIGEKIGITQHEVGVLRYKLKLPPRFTPVPRSREALELISGRIETARQTRRAAAIAWAARVQVARNEKRARQVAAKFERERLRMLNPPKKRINKKLLRILFDEGVGISELAAHFGIGEQSVKLNLKATR